MKRLYTIFVLAACSFFFQLPAAVAQSPTCEGNSYSAQLVIKKVLSATCTEYQVKVSYDGTRAFGLSHFVIEIPCGDLSNISNTKNFKQVIGKDPTTGLTGLKIDNISSFGTKGADSFTVKFTLCSSGNCTKAPDRVAFKAGQCIDYGSLNNNSGNNTSDKDSKDGKGSSCGNPSHDHSKDKDGGKSCDGKDKDGKNGKDDKDDKGNSCGNPSHDHSKDKDGGKSCDGKDKDGQNGKDDKDDKDGKGNSCGNPSHDHSKDKDGGKSCDGKDKDGKDSKDDKDGKGNSCGNPSQDHSKDKDGGRGCDGKDKDDSGSGPGGGGSNNDGGNGGGGAQQPTCDGNSFSSEIIGKKTISSTCVEYEVKVSYDGTRTFGLSHFVIGIPCGEVKNISNSENWAQVFGKDPTTGTYGLKIDNINGFGENGADSFTVKFTWCADASCNTTLGAVAYKAGQCIDYGTMPDNSNPGDSGGDSDTGDNTGGGDTGGGIGDNSGGGTGGDTGGGTGGDGGSGTGGGTGDGGTGGGNPSDSTATCSTLIAKLQKTLVTCAGAANGQLQVVVQDGKAPFTYAWSTGATTESISNLAAGIYSVTINDANGNTLTLSEIITAPDPITINESVTNPSCSGFSNGAINLNVTGGSGTFTYSWNNGATTQNLSALGSGSYIVTVTDAAGCSVQKTITLTNTTAITLGVKFSHPQCGLSNGLIDITPAGGVEPYTYLWNTGATTQDLQGGSAGTYNVTVTDASGCSVNMVYALRNVSTISLKTVVTPTSCLDNASGAIDLQVTGGTAPYTYLWQDGVTTEDRTGLKAGLYKVTVADAGGCTSTLNVSVFKKTFTVSSEVLQPTCAGDEGSITLTPIDGVAPYTYIWSNGDTDNSVQVVSGSSYTVTITDASGCSVTMVFAMPSLQAISATSVISNTQCGSEGAYAIDLSVTGGRSPYTYTWSNGATTQDVSGLTSGTYSVIIKDAGGCTSTQEVVVSPVTVNWSCLINQPTADIVCMSAGNLLSTSVTDGTTYQWSVSSSDNSWQITAGSNTSTLVYTAGNKGTTATFTLTITKDGCTRTCSYTTSTIGCVEKDNTGGGDPQAGDPCATDTTTTTTTQTDTTTVNTTATAQVAAETEAQSEEFTVSAYPNPFTDAVNFEWTATDDDYVQVEVLDMLGRRASLLFDGPVRKGQSYSCNWVAPGTERIYLYKYKSAKNPKQGKLFMK